MTFYEEYQFLEDFLHLFTREELLKGIFLERQTLSHFRYETNYTLSSGKKIPAIFFQNDDIILLFDSVEQMKKFPLLFFPWFSQKETPLPPTNDHFIENEDIQKVLHNTKNPSDALAMFHRNQSEEEVKNFLNKEKKEGEIPPHLFDLT